MNKPTEEELAIEVSNGINNMSFDPKKFAEAMGNEHRTLQQTFTKVALAWLYQLAETEHCDLRNQASVDAGKKVKEALGEYGDSLPFI